MQIDYQRIVRDIDLRYVEYRVREVENKSEWYQIKPTLMIPVIDINSAQAIGQKLLDTYELAREVRWNFAGVPQGNFIRVKRSKKGRK